MHAALLGAERDAWSLSCALLIDRKEEKKSSNFHLSRFKIEEKKKNSARLIMPSVLLVDITLVLALTDSIKGVC